MRHIEVTVEKLVHGGQGLGTAADGRKIFIWNALPGEKVLVELKKSKKQYAEGVAIEVLAVSPERIEPRDEAYLSTSPWQIMSFAAENTYKQQILSDAYSREHVPLDDRIAFYGGTQEWGYRNKMEYSFWGDENGLHLALFHRASHGKRIVGGSSIAMPVIDEVANKVVGVLDAKGVRASDLKTIVVRANQQGETVVAIFVKREDFKKYTELDTICRGLTVHYSNPKSPASVITRTLYSFGNSTLTDRVLGGDMRYDANSFFQVNVPVFEQAAGRMKEYVRGDPQIVDMYAGVGTIGLACGAKTLVEADELNVSLARQNAQDIASPPTILQVSSEGALEQITNESTILFDPPRAGLHVKVIERLREVRPLKIAYLSCNPSTQARDVALLQDMYTIKALEGYNFFPRTPHIESLALLQLTGK